MSEYQYYEFSAVDRPLTGQQQAELRSRSTRATITASSFVNEYHWGNLKGDPLDWVERYFDAHVYSANWGSCRLLLRLPRAIFNARSLLDYTGRKGRAAPSQFAKAFNAIDTGEHCLLDWWFNDDSGEHLRFSEEADGAGWMARLLPIRDELLRGDTRPLYLGWLARIGNGELRDDDSEPPLPDGLKTLTPAQNALAEFLMLDPDWLAAAAETSPPQAAGSGDDDRFDPWLLELTEDEMRAALRMLLEGRSQEAERTLRRRFLTWEQTRLPNRVTSPELRRVGEIEARVCFHREVREQREREAREAAEARRKTERAGYLTSLLEDEDSAWSAIDSKLLRGSGSSYDQAFRALQDLAEAYAGAKRDTTFRRRLVRLMAQHGKRGAWVTRLTKAGYVWEPKR
ncbi:hypothetical protein [Burkholderia savannae]|uniref:hypothetical protein n=1 Tax=Burkholderia savannae TaxID=1637837 RepID=UPI000AE5369A|nr:hypothetical protein [Burkholderia savannae]